MGIAVITERIAAALRAGELKQVLDSTGFAPICSVGDLLKPWEDMFPGVERSGENDTRDIFAWGGLCKPKLAPQVRRSRRPLPCPRKIAASPSTISPGLFTSVLGIWDYYQLHNKADSALLAQPFDTNGMQRFIQPLFDTVEDYYPLFIPLEMMFEEASPAELTDIHLMLPHYTYEDECAGVVEAFLSGVDSVVGLLQHYYGDGRPELPAKDVELISQVGLEVLTQEYALYQGVKSYDLDKLSDYDSFFGTVTARFPNQMAGDWPIISGNSGYDLDCAITCREDIEFCIAYAEAYGVMIGAMPDPYDMDSREAGTFETFIHELCEVWRKKNNKRSVKWTYPHGKTLVRILGGVQS